VSAEYRDQVVFVGIDALDHGDALLMPRRTHLALVGAGTRRRRPRPQRAARRARRIARTSASTTTAVSVAGNRIDVITWHAQA